MTKISEIHGPPRIPQDEYAGRATMVTEQPYIPYLSLTKGEMELYLATQRARIMAQWYGKDAPQYDQAVTMIDNALNAGVHNGIRWMGAVPDYLQNVARMIKKAERQNQPASKSLFYRPKGIMNGIGQTIIPVDQRRADCMSAAKAKVKSKPQCMYPPYQPGSFCDVSLKSEFSKCEVAFTIEKILNASLEKSSHHMLYKQIPGSFPVPEAVNTKKIFQRTGVEGLALAGNIIPSLMYDWTEVGVLQRNAQSTKVGPIGSIQSSVLLAPDPGASWANLAIWANKQGNRSRLDTLGINGAGIGFVPLVPPVDPVTAGIDIALAVVGALITAITLLKELRSEKAYAMNEAQGFGTAAIQAEQSDWFGKSTTGGISPMLLLGGAAALFLLSDDK